MTRQAKYRFPRRRKMQAIHRFVDEARQSGVLMKSALAAGPAVCEVGGRTLKNFGCCSYMGLEHEQRLIDAACDAAKTFGTQFSISRTYMACGLYETLEAKLDTLTERPCLLAASTTLGHLAALPVLVDDDDLVVLDQFAHASLHMAAELLHENEVQLVRHSRMDRLERKLIEAGGRSVWYILDGVYSMLGDVAPFEALGRLLDTYPNLHLYIDDAHAVSWSGTHGRGGALEALGGHERVVVALSLNKAFSAAGGAIAFPNREMLDRVRSCGGPMLFSGPIQPPMLGAAVASAELHLSDEFASYQKALLDRIDYATELLASHDLRVAADARTPIFLVPGDSPREVYAAVRKLTDGGFYCSPSAYPAVPMNLPSIRFTVTRNQTLGDIEAFISALAQVVSWQRRNPREAPTGSLAQIA